MSKILKIRDSACTGCSACANICPVNAIKMEEDNIGYFKPNISFEYCISCGLCDKACPIITFNDVNNEDVKMYALFANDNVRSVSSSGGAFTLLAKHVLDNNGIVFGAAWEDNFSLAHSYISNEKELYKLQRSKYLQSKINSAYKEVEIFLLNNRLVLFVGTGCQIAALSNYLKIKHINTEKLILVDLYCFCIPPQKVFKRFLTDNFGLNVEKFDFRIKIPNIYTSHIFSYKIKNQETRTVTDLASFFKAYFSGMFAPHNCLKCRFQGDNRQGDISLGDFWGIENHDKALNDGKGTSMVRVNSKKGKLLIESIRQSCILLKETPLDWIRSGQGNCKMANPNQSLFYALIQQGINFNKAVDMALRGKKFDIGMACVQVYNNFGSGITNYAMYKIFKDYGKSVLIITQPYSSIISPNNKSYFYKDPFDKNDCAMFYENKQQMSKLNDICDKFVVGSDQLFNYEIYKYIDSFTKLDWVDEQHEKIAYATSFGMNYIFGNADERKDFKRCIKRFNHVSLREQSAKSLVANNFQIIADCVLDPVFLCKKEHYIQLIEPFADAVPKNQVFCYILDPNLGKGEFLLSCATYLNKKLFVCSDLANTNEFLKTIWTIPTTNIGFNEKWLASIYNADYAIVDSFHGLCFALIFHKNFIVIKNKRRGDERSKCLLEDLGLLERLIDAEKNNDNLNKILSKEIDYQVIDSILEEKKNFSKKWIEDNIINSSI